MIVRPTERLTWRLRIPFKGVIYLFVSLKWMNRSHNGDWALYVAKGYQSLRLTREVQAGEQAGRTLLTVDLTCLLQGRQNDNRALFHQTATSIRRWYLSTTCFHAAHNSADKPYFVLDSGFVKNLISELVVQVSRHQSTA